MSLDKVRRILVGWDKKAPNLRGFLLILYNGQHPTDMSIHSRFSTWAVRPKLNPEGFSL